MVFIVFCCATLTVIISYTNVALTVRKSEQIILDIQKSAFDRQTQRPRGSSFFSRLNVKRNRVEPLSTLFVVAETNSARFTGPSKQTTLTATTMELKTFPSSKGDLTDAPKQMKKITLSPPTSEQAKSNVSSARNQPMVQGIRIASTRAVFTTFLVCAIFVISWIPPWICFFLVTEPGHKLKPTVVRYMLFGKMTYLLNTVANPLIYFAFNKKFREKVRGLVSFK
ncbi:hypothetical protein DPMN_171113 [Dreissena polymorpha]|uniref:G-protein coupled receptors family 1 profile domain-containing protein n=1 Tax=Dreissena polymorpha TaxID=45954 RepID=A0A9D4IC51_DREPO|nr:hypothetical protein DPMN_171113 [Dreissena polymorpha]